MPSMAARDTSCTSPETNALCRSSTKRACSPSRLTPLERPPRRVVARACCRAAYVRGALLGGGSLSGPRSPHLEIRTRGNRGRRLPRAHRRRGRSTPRRPRPRPTRSRVREGNRNDRGHTRACRRRAGPSCSSKNARSCPPLARGLIAWRTQTTRISSARAEPHTISCKAVERLRRSGQLADSPHDSGDRRAPERHPTLSLRELALKCRPPATKASAHRRLRKLLELAAT